MSLIKCADKCGNEFRGKRGQKYGRCPECRRLGDLLNEPHRETPRLEDSEQEAQEREDRMTARARGLSRMLAS